MSSDDAQPPDRAPLLPDSNWAATPTRPLGSHTRLWGPATLGGCIFLEALILLVLVAFCATLVGVSFLMQALLAPPVSATPVVAALITPEPAPTETGTPVLVIPTMASATPAPAVPTTTPSPTVTVTPTPRRSVIYLPVVIRAN